MTADATPTPDDMADTLDILACEYEKRPKGAPSFFDLQPAIRGVHRSGSILAMEFDPAAASAVAELVAAERLCCPGIGWELTRGPVLRLRIQATPAQLDVFEQFLPAEGDGRRPRALPWPAADGRPAVSRGGRPRRARRCPRGHGSS